MVAGREQVHDGQEGRAAAVQGEGVLRVLQTRQVALEGQSCRVAATGVVETHRLAWVGLRESRRQVNGWGHTTEL